VASTTINGPPAEGAPISRRLVWIMAAACGIAVSNLYYNQPLLADIQREFGAALREAGVIPMATQVGYALGLFLFVPLGDMLERRGLIVAVLLLSALSLAVTALSPGLWFLAVASLAVGTTSISAQLLIPFAASITPARERGKTVGTLMSGLVIGILLARTVSGTVGAHFGWRRMYWIAACLMIMLAIALYRLLPRNMSAKQMSYVQLMRSVMHLVVTHPELDEAAFIGAMLFGAFSAFWSTLVFFLQRPPYHYGSEAAGLFGLVGVVGACMAPLAGNLADRRSPRLAVGIAIGTATLSYLAFLFFGTNIWGLIAGVILLDAGVQGGHVANQTRIYRLASDAPSRLNMVYMAPYFIGGSAGSMLGTYGMSIWGWKGVCMVGLAMLALAYTGYFAGYKRYAVSRQA
jgi:predicted MFS family arabinose efflux permease